jgi:predicted RNA-binding Zn ribbon-like protein
MRVPVEPMPLPALVDLVNGWGTQPRSEAHEEHLPPAARALVGLADAIHAVFVAESPTERAALVNGLLDRSGVRPALQATTAGLHEGWTAEKRQASLAAAAVALRTQLSEHPDSRLGTCAGHRCGDIYVDASPNGQRRFCSLTCQNRARVAAFRARRRQGS